MWDDEDEERPAAGWVPLEGRGSLPYALIHGESLVACAAWALGEAEVDLVEHGLGLVLVGLLRERELGDQDLTRLGQHALLAG